MRQESYLKIWECKIIYIDLYRISGGDMTS